MTATVTRLTAVRAPYCMGLIVHSEERRKMRFTRNAGFHVGIINARRLTFLFGSAIFCAGTLIIFSKFVGKLF